MEEQFALSVSFNGKDITLPATFVKFGYSYRIDVEVNEQTLCFDKDEERQWRVAVTGPEQELHKLTTKDLIQSIINTLEQLG